MIELNNITAGYGTARGGEPVLRQVSLTLAPGELLCIIGANGSGKSTLLKTAAGLLAPMEGALLVEGRPAAEMTRQELARQIAWLAKGKSVPDMTVEQLVLHGRFPHLSYPRRYSRRDRELAEAAMAQMGLAELAERPLATLSGGMRQNAFLAMALAQDAAYILLDEPTTYLDIAHQLRLMKTLRALADGGKGVAAVLHDLPLAFSFADRAALVDQGRIIACGPPEDLCRSGLIPEIFGVGLEYDAGKEQYFYRYEERQGEK